MHSNAAAWWNATRIPPDRRKILIHLTGER